MNSRGYRARSQAGPPAPEEPRIYTQAEKRLFNKVPEATRRIVPVNTRVLSSALTTQLYSLDISKTRPSFFFGCEDLPSSRKKKTCCLKKSN